MLLIKDLFLVQPWVDYSIGVSKRRRYLLYNFLCHRYFRLLSKRLSGVIQTDSTNHFGLLSHLILFFSRIQSNKTQLCQNFSVDKMTPSDQANKTIWFIHSIDAERIQCLQRFLACCHSDERECVQSETKCQKLYNKIKIYRSLFYLTRLR